MGATDAARRGSGSSWSSTVAPKRRGSYTAKLAAYFRYRDAGMAARDYSGFPTLLVVTTSAAAEARFAYQAYLMQERRGGTPLLIFLTTIGRIEGCPDGVLGPIWRSPAEPWAHEPARSCWLPRPDRPALTRA